MKPELPARITFMVVCLLSEGFSLCAVVAVVVALLFYAVADESIAQIRESSSEGDPFAQVYVSQA